MTVGMTRNASGAPSQADATVRPARETAAVGPRSAWSGQTFGADSRVTEVVSPGTEIAGKTDRRRTWALLGEPADRVRLSGHRSGTCPAPPKENS